MNDKTTKTISKWLGPDLFTVSSWYPGVTYNDKLYVNGKRVNACEFIMKLLMRIREEYVEEGEEIEFKRQLSDAEVMSLFMTHSVKKEDVIRQSTHAQGKPFNFRLYNK